MGDSALYVIFSILTAWASIERNILVFFPNWFRPKRKCFLFHYVPLLVCFLYPTIFYTITLIIIPCDIPFNYMVVVCDRYACVSLNSRFSLWDSIANYIIPAFNTVIFSIILLVGVLYKRYRAQGRIDWRNYRKLTLQLLPISFLYIALQLPPMIMYTAYTAGMSWDVGANYYGDALTFTYWVILFNPLASVVSLPGLKTKCKNVVFFWRARQAIRPEIMEMTPRSIHPQLRPTAGPQTVSVTRRNFGPQTRSTSHRNMGQTSLVAENIL
jgi:hypothetical protein